MAFPGGRERCTWPYLPLRVPRGDFLRAWGLHALWSPRATPRAGPLNRWIVLFGRVPPLSCRAVGMVQFRPWPSWAGGPPPCPSPSPPPPARVVGVAQ